MFAGLSGLVLDDEKTTITGISSAQGEQMLFTNTISLKNNPKINEWLSALEREMKVSLALQFQRALDDYEKLKGSFEDNAVVEGFMKFVDDYAAQIVLLVIQVSWCKKMEGAFTPNVAGLEAVLQYVE